MKIYAILLSIALAFPGLVFAEDNQVDFSHDKFISNALQIISNGHIGNKRFTVNSASIGPVIKDASDVVNVTVNGEFHIENGTDTIGSEPAIYIVSLSKETGDVLTVSRMDEQAARAEAKNWLTEMYVLVPEGKVEGDKISYDTQVGNIKCQVIMTKSDNLPLRWLASDVRCQKYPKL